MVPVAVAPEPTPPSTPSEDPTTDCRSEDLESLPAAEAEEPVPERSPPPPLPQPEGGGLERRRRVPRRLRIALGAGLAVLALVVVAGRGGRRENPPTKLVLHDEVVMSEEDLKNRREVEADDFTRKERYLTVKPAGPKQAPSALRNQAEGPAREAELEERRARRESDPEDLISRRGETRRRAHAADETDPGARGREEAPLYLEPRKPSGSAGDRPSIANGTLVARAGDVISAVLPRPLSVEG